MIFHSYVSLPEGTHPSRPPQQIQCVSPQLCCRSYVSHLELDGAIYENPSHSKQKQNGKTSHQHKNLWTKRNTQKTCIVYHSHDVSLGSSKKQDITTTNIIMASQNVNFTIFDAINKKKQTHKTPSFVSPLAPGLEQGNFGESQHWTWDILDKSGL